MKILKFGKVFCATVFVFLFLSTDVAYADYDVSGRWLLEGGGRASKGVLRVSMTVDGYLDVTTVLSKDEVLLEDGEILSGDLVFLTEYYTHARLNASRLDIKAWDYDKNVVQKPPIPIPPFDLTMSKPLVLPTVPVEDMTYQLTFTSPTSGVIKIKGTLNVDYVGDVEIDSESVIWKDGTERPDIDDKTSGCNTGSFVGLAGFLVLSHVIVYNRKNIF
ncbi:hypothetical protein FACS1894187_00290 [Synergistales bacterium]|nr:hypothetical protein FACS1894187_00290 [Synergistales bacterium]